MPIKPDREYRAMSLLLPAETKRIESDYYVEGYATTFNDPYVLYEWDGVQYKEQVDRSAFQGADMSDIIMQYDHAGRVYARNKMGGGKPPTLIAEPQESGFFVAADLSRSDGAKQLYADMVAGLVYKMSWAFTVAKDDYDKDTHTRTILRVRKVYDVSAVSYPANPNTDISARSWLDGVIEAEKREAQARLELAKRKYFYFHGGTK
jgi:HK97 family phage prohead protease